MRRALWASHLQKIHPPLLPVAYSLSSSPKVTIIVPSRNEEKNILNCLTHLTRQNYSNFEILVINDRSTDHTGEIVSEFSKKSPIPIKMITIEKLPAGWTGKNYGMFTGSRAAQGEWILFTDADTTHKPESLSTALMCAVQNKIDFLTLAPETESRSFWEKTVQPLAVGSLALWFQSDKVNDPKSKIILANGQFILVKKEAYENVGGNESVKTEVVEDVELARKFRERGFVMQFLNGTKLYATRMYATLKEIKTGWTRIFTYLFNKNIPTILHKLFLFLFFSSLPFLILLFEISVYFLKPNLFSASLFYTSLIVSGLIVLVRFMGNKMLKTDPWYAFLHLLGSFVMIWILAICIYRIAFNRASVWRGDYHK